MRSRRFRSGWMTFILILGLGNICWSGAPDDNEQLWLQLINRFRANPAAELDLLANYVTPQTGTEFDDPLSDDPDVAGALAFFGVDAAALRSQFQDLQPVPPLAWNVHLHDSATYYSELIIENDQQSHELDRYNALQRVERNSDYDFAGGGAVAENIFAFTNTVTQGHAGFVIDWGLTPSGIQDPPGHRNSLINAELREIGVAMIAENNAGTSVGPNVVTQYVAVDFNDGPFLTGVAFVDVNRNQFYDPGEGLGQLTIEVIDDNSAQAVATTTTFDSGGFTADLTGVSPGYFNVRISGAKVNQVLSRVDLTRGHNVALDIANPHPDIDALAAATINQRYEPLFDLDYSGQLEFVDRRVWVEQLKNTFFGDSNLDGQFGSGDLVVVFQAGQYEDDVVQNSLWTTGDWSGDLEFDTSDLVLAFQEGGYENGLRAATAVPEPTSSLVTCCVVLAFISTTLLGPNRRSGSY